MEQFEFTVLTAQKGGMIDHPEGRDVYATDEELALAIGKYILSEIVDEDACDAIVTFEVRQ